jgi:hAT family C-terminal dimerisation region
VPADDTKSVDDTRRENLYMQFTDFVISAECERKSNSFRFKMLRDKRKTPLQYWQADGVSWPLLQYIAIKLFAMATSSAASERNFSTFGFIHSRLRNSLAPEKVQKLVFIKTNYRAFADTLVEYSDNEFSSDRENEEVEINETY